MDINEFRKQNPVYDDMSDGALAYGFYQKNYTDMPMGEFADKVNLSSEGFKQMIATAKEKGRNVTSSSTTQEGPGNNVITGFNQKDQSFVNPNSDETGNLLSNTAQGITMGWSDEIFGHIYAMTESLGGTELSYDELYNRMVEFERKRLSDYADKNPKKAFAGEVGGAIVSSFAATPAMTLLKSSKFLMELNKGWKAFLSSGAAGALYGAGTGEEGERTTNALVNAGISSVSGFVLQKPLGYVSGKFDKLFNRANEAPSVENLKNLKNEAYDEAKKLGIKFNGDLTEKYRIQGANAMDESYDPAIDKYTQSAFKLFNDTLDDAYLNGASFERLDKLNRQLWGKLRQSGGAEVKIYDLINAVNDLIASHPDQSAASMAAKSANVIYNKAKTIDWEFEKAMNNADITGNKGQKLKAAVRNILNNKKLRNSFDDADLKQMKAFTEGNISDKTLKNIGKIAPSSGGLMSWISIGAIAANPYMALAAAVAEGSKSSFSKRATKGANDLLNYIKQFKPDNSIVSGVPGGAAAGSGQALDQLQQ